MVGHQDWLIERRKKKMGNNKMTVDTGPLFQGVIQIFRDLQVIGVNRVEVRSTHKMPRYDADGHVVQDEMEMEIIVEKE